jgi:hypothetical protein
LILSFFVRWRLVPPGAVSAATKYLDDGKQVVGELLFSSRIFSEVHLDPSIKLSACPLEELKGEATQSVALGNHDLAHMSLEDTREELLKTWPLEVDPAADVGDDLVLRIG